MNAPQASIALFIPNLAGGGAERVMVTLANEFANHASSVTLLLANANDMRYGHELNDNVHLKIFNRSRVIRTLPDLIRYLKINKPDVLLTTLNHVSFTAALAVMIANTGTRLVVREDLAPEPCPPALRQPGLYAYHRLIQWAYNRAHAVISLSEDMTTRLQDYYQLRTPVRTIHNPLPLAHIAKLSKEKPEPTPPWTSTSPMILAVGRLHTQKDLPTLLHAFAGLADKDRHTAKLAILGEGAERATLEQLARELGIENQVWLPGYVGNPYAFMKQAAAYVLCSRREGLPNSLIQALACGTACIATDCPTGPREILADGKRGVLIKIGDVAALTTALTNVLNAHRLSAQRSSTDMPSFLKQYDTGNITSQYLDALLSD